MHIQAVVDAQFEDRIPARTCPRDSLKRARLYDMNENGFPSADFREYGQGLVDFSPPPEPPNLLLTQIHDPAGWLAWWLAGWLADCRRFS